jgi:hypothetical protein
MDGRWIVSRYTDTVCLSGVRFVVSAKGRDYCRAKQARWVHAWAEGTECAPCGTAGDSVVYNPFRNEGFVRESDGSLITATDHAAFSVDASTGTRRAITMVQP